MKNITLIYTFFHFSMNSGPQAWSFSVMFLFVLVSGEIFAYILTCENVGFFPRPGSKPNAQIFLVFYLKKILG